MRNRRIYIAGQITGNPKYKEQFLSAELKLTLEGWNVYNPAQNNCYSYREYIDTGLHQLMHSDAIYLLNGWKESKGATLEAQYAMTVGLDILHEVNADE